MVALRDSDRVFLGDVVLSEVPEPLIPSLESDRSAVRTSEFRLKGLWSNIIHKRGPKAPPIPFGEDRLFSKGNKGNFPPPPPPKK
jgi:hypothetical protein